MYKQQNCVGKFLFLKTFLLTGIFVRSSNFFLVLFPIGSVTFDGNRKWNNPNIFFRALTFKRLEEIKLVKTNIAVSFTF